MVFLVMCTRNPVIFGSAPGLGICDGDFSLDKNHNGEIRKQISEMNPQLINLALSFWPKFSLNPGYLW